jgi:hypothetical protein
LISGARSSLIQQVLGVVRHSSVHVLIFLLSCTVLPLLTLQCLIHFKMLVQEETYSKASLHSPKCGGKSDARRLRWSSGLRAGLCFPSSRVRTLPKPLDFSV